MNRHIKIAIVMAPVLGLLAYLITDRVVETTPVQNATFELNASEWCLPMENQCLLKKGPLEIKLIGKVMKDQMQLAVLSNEPVSQMSFALAENETRFKQYPLMKSEGDKYWQLKLDSGEDISSMAFFRIALEHNTNSYYLQHPLKLNGN